MKFIADLHIHSHYSLATSKELTPEHLDLWARIKGIGLVATGDFTHPKWIAELRDKLIPAENDLFKLKPELRLKLPFENQDVANKEVRFVLSSEISGIYKKNGKVRKVHNLLYAPDFETVEKMQAQLSKIGNITSDGRPILGFDSRDLLELALNISPKIFFVPAHIWTPWFSVLGEKGGFDSIEECYGDLTPHIHALETGLSTDPALNWMCSFLDQFTLLSNSDAHSPDRLGRNANILDCEFDYDTIFNSIKKADGQSFLGTIDMFPQEGKYHYDGHRKCGVCFNPVETLRNRAICPVCGKRVVVGVASRIAQLSDRTDISQRPNRRDFHSIIPLPEILSEIMGSGESSKKVKQWYFQLLQKGGSEFDILLNHNIETIESIGGPVLAEAIKRMREGRILITEGYDGEYGIIKVFKPGEHKLFEAGEKLFSTEVNNSEIPKRKLLNFELSEYRKLIEENYSFQQVEEQQEEYETDWLHNFNPEQKAAVMHHKGPAIVLAGPGTGKTRVLTTRIAGLINHYQVNPENILALTFTNKAAGEIKERLEASIEAENAKKITVSTFHALGLQILKENLSSTGRHANFQLIGEEELIIILKDITGKSNAECKELSKRIEHIKQFLLKSCEIEDSQDKELFEKYSQYLIEANAFDLEDLIYEPYHLFSSHPEIQELYMSRYSWILIDEYQDINYNQYQWIKSFTSKNQANLFAIGDPNQSIYGFRGADLKFINSFTEDFNGAATYKLKRSYRCTDRILTASSQVLNITSDDTLKGSSKGLKLRIDSYPDDKTEALNIARNIDKLIGGMQFYSLDKGLEDSDSNLALSDIAILCRTKRQMDTIKQILMEKNIPFQETGTGNSFEKNPYRAILLILNNIVNPRNKLTQLLLEDAKIKIDSFSHLDQGNHSVTEHISKITEILISDTSIFEEAQFKQFLNIASLCENDISLFIQKCRLGLEIDNWSYKAGKISLMTLHASKGLEFAAVFIPGCEEGLMPYTLYRDNTDKEEEKRLLYVGMTRASQYLFISHATRRFIFNKEYRLPKSPFLDQIENTLFELSFKEKKKEKVPDQQLRLF
jgi:DNA helicase II / ATP-dependent DNA helicase PcrA